MPCDVSHKYDASSPCHIIGFATPPKRHIRRGTNNEQSPEMSSRYLCRQFLLSGRATIPFDGWTTCTTPSYFLSHHPELPVRQLRSGNTSLTLIGYCIDPEHPLSSDATILDDLFRSLQSKNRLIEAASRLAGRWILVAETPEFSIALHDACGLRSLFYSDSSCSVQFCASEATTAAKAFTLEEDHEATSGFLNTAFAKNNVEYWWPGDATQFRGVRALLPNHYLDLRAREAIRYSAERAIGDLALRDAAEIGAMYLSNLIQGAASRFQLALPLTAGWDSRAILAACHAVSVEPHCYTLRFGAMTERSQDIKIPKQILAKLSWIHHVIDCKDQPSPEFVSVYKASADPAHDEACQLAYALLKEFPKERVTLSGHCSEIARCFYKTRAAKITPEVLANLTGMDHTPFVLGHFDRWLEGARNAFQSSGVPILDLFYWEQRVGRWAANGQGQWDLVHERFSPFSCRPLLFSLLSTPEKYRREPHHRLYHRMIEDLSSVVLAEPINPDSTVRGWNLRLLARRFSGNPA